MKKCKNRNCELMINDGKKDYCCRNHALMEQGNVIRDKKRQKRIQDAWNKGLIQQFS